MGKEQVAKYAELMERVSKLQYAQENKAELFERERKENIRERYNLLKEAVATGYNTDQMLKHVAELGMEFEAGKAYPYMGGSPF